MVLKQLWYDEDGSAFWLKAEVVEQANIYVHEIIPMPTKADDAAIKAAMDHPLQAAGETVFIHRGQQVGPR